MDSIEVVAPAPAMVPIVVLVVMPGADRGAGGDGAQQPQPPDCIIELLEQDAGKGLSHDPEDLPEPVSLEKIQAALSVIDPDIERAHWFAIGCGLV